MQVGTMTSNLINPAAHHLARRNSFNFRSQQSPLNPTTISSTKQHLANLEKLLQKHQPVDNGASNHNHRDVGINGFSGRTSLASKGKALLEGLNLARVWPEVKAAADEMSPRRLQRLLSLTPEYSPRNNLSSRWREYHGCKDWAGLLDPLDENLRREVVRYGEFVQAAYRGFHSDPATSAGEAPAARHMALPDKSYKVTKSLYATSSVGLPGWVDDMAPDLGWMTQRSSWIGYVAVCDDKREIQRMGRRDIVIALRGTSTCLEWAENMRAQLVQMHDCDDPAHVQAAKVECGFMSLFKTGGTHVPSLAQAVEEEVQRLIELYEGETLSITITGHSLGAALALLVADRLSTCEPHVPPIAVFSFGGPRVGNKAFADQINNKNVKVLRIVNNQDVITKVPGLPMEDVMPEDMPLPYSHVGTELRVDTRMSPYLKPNADMACCHDLEAYLHLVDGFIASNCPFRSNAKRSLVKLLSEQGSNVKRLYTSKAKSLTLKNLERPGIGLMATSGCLPSPSQ